MPSLRSATHAAIRAGWARQLDVPVSLPSEPGVHVEARDGGRGIVVLELGEVVVVVAPPQAAERLRVLDRERLVDIDEVVAAVGDPSARPIGTATLSFADRGSLVTHPREESAMPADPGSVAKLLAEVAPDEGDESGIAGMSRCWMLQSDDAVPTACPVAVAGYEPWHDRIAQFGVLVHASSRGRGAGRRVTGTAAAVALEERLVPQWRCRVGNHASLRLAGRLGFVPVGRQLAIALDRHLPDR